MAIQNRRGAYSDFDASKMVEGELAVVQSGDTNTSTGKSVYVCYTSGDVQRFITDEEVSTEIGNAMAGSGTFQGIVAQDVEDYLEAHPELTTTVEDGAVTRVKLNDSAVANNLTTASAGTAVLDAYQGKVLKDAQDELSASYDTTYTSFGYGFTNVRAKRRGKLVQISLGATVTSDHGMASGTWYTLGTLDTQYRPSSNVAYETRFPQNNYDCPFLISVTSAGALRIIPTLEQLIGVVNVSYWYFID